MSNLTVPDPVPVPVSVEAVFSLGFEGCEDVAVDVAAAWAIDDGEGWRYSYVCWRIMLLSWFCCRGFVLAGE